MLKFKTNIRYGLRRENTGETTKGANVSLLLGKQNQLKAEKQALERRGIELQETLDAMPDHETVRSQATFIRDRIMMFTLTENWQNRSYEDLRRFLHFLFSDNPRQNHYGIVLGKENKKWHICFEGCFDFKHGLITDNRINDEIHNAYQQINVETRETYKQDIKEVDGKYVKACKEMGITVNESELFNGKDYL